MNKEELKKLALTLKFDIKKDVLENLENEYKILKKSIDKLINYKIDEEINPISRIGEKINDYLREDEETKIDFYQEDAFKNTTTEKSMIVLKRVVK